MLYETLLIISAYLVGSIPLGYTVARLVGGINLREYGTGNVGASNVYRNVGKGPAVLVAVGDIVKGLWPVVLARYLNWSDTVVALAGLAAIVGYDWPIFTRFKGGRGLAASIGACAPLLLSWFVLLAVAFVVGSAIKRVAVFMIVTFAVLPVFLWWEGQSPALIAMGVAVWLLLLVRRLDGIGEDLLLHQNKTRIIADRLLFDHRPGQRLTGHIASQSKSGRTDVAKNSPGPTAPGISS
ncbi:MAG: glycerol-3-phosphate acyltransferase [Chloroflexota bacterium]|nr:MAG: glycerol-3-phosphate acyltransferase [Chloroflexota bacterium]